jgi:protein TonB
LYRENPAPSYPAVARRRGYEGTVLLNVLVDKGGQVAELRVEESSGHAMLDQAALRSVRGWRFEPAVRGDEKVSMWVRVPIRFQLR